MLILAEGTVHHSITGSAKQAAAAWLGPMVDGGFLQGAYVDSAGKRVWMVLSAPDHVDVDRRLNDLPIVRDGHVSFITTQVTALRYT